MTHRRRVLVTSGGWRGVEIARTIVSHRTGRGRQLPAPACGAHRRRAMRPARTLALVLFPLLASAAAEAAPRGRPLSRPSLEVRAPVRTVTDTRRFTEHVLRELPTAARQPGDYAQRRRWGAPVRRGGPMAARAISVTAHRHRPDGEGR